MAAASVNPQHPSLRDALAATRGSLICALIVLLLDILVYGSYLFAVLICPVWFVVSAVRTIVQRPSLGVAAVRLLLPIVTFLVVIANDSLQKQIATRNAARVIQACKEYHAANGAYPERLDDLAPRYLSSVPRAKYCLAFGELTYFASSHHILVWCELPPYGRRIYEFEDAKWSYLD